MSQHLDNFWKEVSFCWQPKNSLLAWNPYRTAGQFVIEDSYFIPFSSLFSFKGQFQNKCNKTNTKKLRNKTLSVSKISWTNRKLKNLEYFQRQYIWCVKIKGFNAVFGPITCIKAFCLYFNKTGITDFEIILKIFSEKEGFLFSFILIGKCFKNLWKLSHSSFFTLVYPKGWQY